jgi:hypothetical protein
MKKSKPFAGDRDQAGEFSDLIAVDSLGHTNWTVIKIFDSVFIRLIASLHSRCIENIFKCSLKKPVKILV